MPARTLRAIGGALAIAGGIAVMSACAVGPDYKRPPVAAAADYKEQSGWKPSEPNDALGRGPWWEIFNDETLNGLEAKINISNENVKAARRPTIRHGRWSIRRAPAFGRTSM